jgi:hypothetical protein
MSEDRGLLQLVSAELCAMGCRVFCARGLEELADLVRRGLSKKFVLISLGPEVVSAAEVREALVERLPDWSIQAGAAAEMRERERVRQPPN